MMTIKNKDSVDVKNSHYKLFVCKIWHAYKSMKTYMYSLKEQILKDFISSTHGQDGGKEPDLYH